MNNYKHLPEEETKIPLKLADWGILVPKSRSEKIFDEMSTLTRDERVKISAYPTRESDWFQPYGARPLGQEVKKYPLSWWNTLTIDEQSFYQAVLVFQDQVFGEVVDKRLPIGFYEPITLANALDWHHVCPLHLRKRIDEEINKVNPRVVERSDNEELWDAIAYDLGDRPKVQYFMDEGKVELRSYFQMGVYQRWCVLYQQEAAKRIITKHATAIQQERKMLNEAMGIDIDEDGLPNQAEGLDTTIAATVRWLQASGQMPLEFLANTYRDNSAKLSDRITAARTLMDYVHRRVPVKQEVKTEEVGTPKLDPSALRGLNSKELDTLEKILAKLSQNG